MPKRAVFEAIGIAPTLSHENVQPPNSSLSSLLLFSPTARPLQRAGWYVSKIWRFYRSSKHKCYNLHFMHDKRTGKTPQAHSTRRLSQKFNDLVTRKLFQHDTGASYLTSKVDSSQRLSAGQRIQIKANQRASGLTRFRI
ncbi:MAG: hypothetical protein PHI13_00915 [Methylococcales bacterium]|nr:hypothetical protein [Methylococcales bacterium]